MTTLPQTHRRHRSSSALLHTVVAALEGLAATLRRRIRSCVLWMLDMNEWPRVEMIDKLEVCPICGEVGEYGTHMCPSAMEGVCMGCGRLWAPLDRYGLCAVDPGHEVGRRRFKNPAERWGRKERM